MRIEGQALRARIYVGESDSFEGRPLYSAIVERLRDLGIAGATVMRGIEGYGRNARLHTTRILRRSEDLPILIEFIDEEAKVRAVLPSLDEMVSEGLITLEPVDVIAYRSPEKR